MSFIVGYLIGGTTGAALWLAGYHAGIAAAVGLICCVYIAANGPRF